ncbi:MAG: ATP-binding protein [Hyphomicrobiaceae bacterium]|nr:ATP-binding protein [Hyphomicrobiaceae bacterium]
MKKHEQLAAIKSVLVEISGQLARLNGDPGEAEIEIGAAHAYVWDMARGALRPVTKINRVPLDLLQGIARLRDQLFVNTEQFAKGHAANNVLLWGAKGMGKSSLVKAVHAEIIEKAQPSDPRLVLIEIHREDIESLPVLLRGLAGRPERFILFCDDLSFSEQDSSYKSLKSVLDGGLEGRPANVLFYATSNRRHLLPRNMIENEQATAVNPGEAIDEKVSLSDRFGLWLGFHNCDQDTFFAMIEGYVRHYAIPVSEADWRKRAVEWAQLRGGRSGRVAIQFVRQLAGEHGISI